MKKIIEKIAVSFLGGLSMIFLWMLIVAFTGMCSCSAKVVPHNIHKKPPNSNKGFYHTPYGVYHKSVLDNPKKYEKQ